MEYFFILGNNPTLSIAELVAVINDNERCHVNDGIFYYSTKEDLDSQKLIRLLGGTIKIGRIIDKCSKDKNDILNTVKNELQPGEGKYNFGISYYGNKKYNIKPLGMEIKKHLKEKGVSCRWVTSKESQLSSVVVEQNKLLKNGKEIILIEKKGSVFVGVTEAVQAFKELSKRDYGRPARDDHSGMLPPKLAQIMINLSGANTIDGAKPNRVLLDAFCGSGTVLTEALLQGHKSLIGSDISKKAVRDTEENLKWIAEKSGNNDFDCEIIHQDVTKLNLALRRNSVDFIVSEPFLGPQRGKLELDKVVKDLNILYGKAISEFKKVLRPEGRIVMLFPVFFNKTRIEPNLHGLQIVKPIPKDIKFNNMKLTDRNTIVYGREGQRVYREIVVMKLK